MYRYVIGSSNKKYSNFIGQKTNNRILNYNNIKNLQLYKSCFFTIKLKLYILFPTKNLLSDKYTVYISAFGNDPSDSVLR